MTHGEPFGQTTLHVMRGLFGDFEEPLLHM